MLQKIKILIQKAFTNKVVFYMLSRYLIYFITFISSMMIATKLGPYYLGIWGFILLLIRYFHIIDFGIGNSITVFLVQNKKDSRVQADYEATAMSFMLLVSFLVIIIGVYFYVFGISLFDKCHIGAFFYAVCAIAIMQYFNDYFFKVYRVKGKMFEFTFYQSIIQLLVFVVIFFAKGEKLIILLTLAYVLGHVISLFFFLKGGGVRFNGKPSFVYAKNIISKGFMLFVYNVCFYLIIISTKTLIGANYTVEEFGFFTFSYTLAHAALVLLEAFSTLITPKLIDKFNTDDSNQIHRTIKLLRVNYICLSHGLMYMAMMVFPILLLFLPKYTETLRTINLTALATVLYTNCFGYTSFLIAKNKEKQMATNSVIALFFNVILALLLIKVFKVSYEYVVIATLVAYFMYAYLVVHSGQKVLNERMNFIEVLGECFPNGVLVPFISAIAVTLINNKFLMWIPVVVFVSLNTKEIKEIGASFKRILFKPETVDMES